MPGVMSLFAAEKRPNWIRMIYAQAPLPAEATREPFPVDRVQPGQGSDRPERDEMFMILVKILQQPEYGSAEWTFFSQSGWLIPPSLEACYDLRSGPIRNGLMSVDIFRIESADENMVNCMMVDDMGRMDEE